MESIRRPRLGAVLREIATQTASLVVPRQCPCGAEGTWLCEPCTRLLEQPPVRVDSCCDALQVLSAARVRGDAELPAGVDHAPVLPVLALGEYEGGLQRLILAWKNGGLSYLAERLAPYLTAPVRSLAESPRPTVPWLVPVPSGLGARLRRGQDHTADLVRALGANGAGQPLLLPSLPTTTQEGRTARQRRTRRVRLLRSAAPVNGSPRGACGRRPVVIIDDVVTTGSTLRGMHEALTGAGFEVIGAVVVASARIPAPVRIP